jgi:hypothetical protein
MIKVPPGMNEVVLTIFVELFNVTMCIYATVIR